MCPFHSTAFAEWVGTRRLEPVSRRRFYGLASYTRLNGVWAALRNRVNPAVVTTFLIRGFEPLADNIAYGRDLLPLTKQLIAERAGGAKAA